MYIEYIHVFYDESLNIRGVKRQNSKNLQNYRERGWEAERVNVINIQTLVPLPETPIERIRPRISSDCIHSGIFVV